VKILRNYIVKEFIPPYLGSVAFFSVLLLLERIMSFVGLVARGYADIFDLLLLLFYSLPPTIAITMPMSVIMGALVAVGRLSHDSEITAMRAAGIRLSGIFVSLYIVGAIIAGLSFYIGDRLVPSGNIRFRTLYQRLTLARPEMNIDMHSINKVNPEVTLLVESVDDRTGELIDITIFEREKGQYARTITAERGWFISEGEWSKSVILRLKNGVVVDPRDRQAVRFDATVFDRLDITIKLEHRELKNIARTPRDMNIKELLEAINGKKSGTKEYNIYKVELNKRIAIPFACLLFVFIGTPFAITRGRSGRGLGLGIGVLIIFFYYLFLLVLERLGKRGTIPPDLAVWLPNIVFAMAGMVNMIRKSRI